MKFKHLLRLAIVLVAAVLAIAAARAADAPEIADDPALEKRVNDIGLELRCLVCQNQTIADSHAGLAEDLREEVRGMIRKGASDEQIVKYMTDRCGDFVLYRPPVKGSTALLWFGPAALLLVGCVALVVVLRRRARLPDDRFEPEPDDEAAGQGAQP